MFNCSDFNKLQTLVANKKPRTFLLSAVIYVNAVIIKTSGMQTNWTFM